MSFFFVCTEFPSLFPRILFASRRYDRTRTAPRISLTPVTEQFHSTPETQTDESYNHPEDIEHFAHHKAIEREEARREAKYQGITVEEALAQHDHDAEPQKPKVTRVAPPEKQDPEVRHGDAKEESRNRAEWGAGDEGFKTPKTPAERLRKNVPYKVNCPTSYPQSVACQSLMKEFPDTVQVQTDLGRFLTPSISPGSYPSKLSFHTEIISRLEPCTFRDIMNASGLVSNKLIYRASNMSSIEPFSTAIQSTIPPLA